MLESAHKPGPHRRPAARHVMRPWKPSPNPAFDLSVGSPRAQAATGFVSLWG
jgi:hypothetical protein